VIVHFVVLLMSLCDRSDWLHYESCLSVRSFVCPFGLLAQKQKGQRKVEIGVNVSQSRNKWCANFSFRQNGQSHHQGYGEAG